MELEISRFKNTWAQSRDDLIEHIFLKYSTMQIYW